MLACEALVFIRWMELFRERKTIVQIILERCALALMFCLFCGGADKERHTGYKTASVSLILWKIFPLFVWLLPLTLESKWAILGLVSRRCQCSQEDTAAVDNKQLRLRLHDFEYKEWIWQNKQRFDLSVKHSFTGRKPNHAVGFLFDTVTPARNKYTQRFNSGYSAKGWPRSSFKFSETYYLKKGKKNSTFLPAKLLHSQQMPQCFSPTAK